MSQAKEKNNKAISSDDRREKKQDWNIGHLFRYKKDSRRRPLNET